MPCSSACIKTWSQELAFAIDQDLKSTISLSINSILVHLVCIMP